MHVILFSSDLKPFFCCVYMHELMKYYSYVLTLTAYAKKLNSVRSLPTHQASNIFCKFGRN